jgi:hypothetical protein
MAQVYSIPYIINEMQHMHCTRARTHTHTNARTHARLRHMDTDTDTDTHIRFTEREREIEREISFFISHTGPLFLSPLHDAGAQVARVGDLLEEEAVLAGAGRVEGVLGRPDGHDQVVVLHGELLAFLNL